MILLLGPSPATSSVTTKSDPSAVPGYVHILGTLAYVYSNTRGLGNDFSDKNTRLVA